MKNYADEKDDLSFIGNTNTFKEADSKHLYLKNDISGIHLNRDGQKELMSIIQNAVKKHQTKLASKKRDRYSEDTPPSAEKISKARKFSGSVNVKDKDK